LSSVYRVSTSIEYQVKVLKNPFTPGITSGEDVLVLAVCQ